MILIDTSVWVDHLCFGDSALARLLERGEALTHPFVIGEIALGALRQRELLSRMLSRLPGASVATDAEAFRFIERHSLFGRGVDYVDAHLLAAVRLTVTARLWIYDRQLREAAITLNLAAPFS